MTFAAKSACGADGAAGGRAGIDPARLIRGSPAERQAVISLCSGVLGEKRASHYAGGIKLAQTCCSHANELVAQHNKE